jgi:integrase
MGRTATGWKLRQRAPGHAYAVRFWINGREHERSTGTSDPVEAAREASRIYAEEVRKEPPKRVNARRGRLKLEELIAAWVTALEATHDPSTRDTWELYANTHWLPHFKATHNLTAPLSAEYMRARLRVVQGSTVRKELSALRQFYKWCVEVDEMSEAPIVPSVSKRSPGKVFEKRRRVSAIELSPDECLKIIGALPQWSTSKRVPVFPIRARFLVGYETGLRPETLDLLQAPKHYRKKSSTITLSPDIDKNRLGREVPVSKRAREALDSVCPDEGLIFGAHDYREHLAAAASAVLPKERADKFTGAHLRSARITHWLEQSQNLAGVQYLAGHRNANTTAKYVRASLRAALEVVAGADAARETSKSKKRAKR